MSTILTTLIIVNIGIFLLQFAEGEVVITTPKNKHRFTFKGLFTRTETPF